MPILVDGADMPEGEGLPDDLEGLARRNALEMDFKRLDAEAGRLVAAIRRILETPEPGPGAPAPGATAAGGAPGGTPAEVASRKHSEVRAEAPCKGALPAPAPTPPVSAQ